MNWKHFTTIHGVAKCAQSSFQIGLLLNYFTKTCIAESWEISFGLFTSSLMLICNFANIIYGVIYPVSFEKHGITCECYITLSWIVIWILQYFIGSCLFFHPAIHKEAYVKYENDDGFIHTLPFIFTSIMLMFQIGLTLIFLSKEIYKLADTMRWIERSYPPSIHSLSTPVSHSAETLDSSKSPSVQTLVSNMSPSIQTLSSICKSSQNSCNNSVKLPSTSNKAGNMIIANEGASLLNEYPEEEVKEKYETLRKGNGKVNKPLKENIVKKDEASDINVDMEENKITPPKIVGCIEKHRIVKI